MKTHPIDAAAIGAVALIRLARAVLVPCVALVLTVAGWSPAPAAVASDIPMVSDRILVAGLPVAVRTPAAALGISHHTVRRRSARAVDAIRYAIGA
jgi:hypothetical protein